MRFCCHQHSNPPPSPTTAIGFGPPVGHSEGALDWNRSRKQGGSVLIYAETGPERWSSGISLVAQNDVDAYGLETLSVCGAKALKSTSLKKWVRGRGLLHRVACETA